MKENTVNLIILVGCITIMIFGGLLICYNVNTPLKYFGFFLLFLGLLIMLKRFPLWFYFKKTLIIKKGGSYGNVFYSDNNRRYSNNI